MSSAIKPLAERIDSLKSKFNDEYGKNAEYVVRAPGRVNIIGEHIDYCGYGVFPMAVDQDILVAVCKNSSGSITLNNVESRYTTYTCNANDFKIDSTKPQWYDYYLCGVRAISEQFPDVKIPGMSLLVEGCLPPAAGMSSSSALVCASALTTLHAIGRDMEREELASLCAKCERYIGVQGGGMDQAICLLAEKSSAKLIQFEPKLSSTSVNLPEEAVFIVANSCVEINKGNTSYYNIRVVECRLAAQLILKTKGHDWEKPVRLCDAQKALNLSLEEMSDVVDEILHEEPYSLKELCQLFSMNENRFVTWALSEKTKDLTSFKLHARAKHVFGEADRVFKFKRACEEQNLADMGRLMSDSHNSCRDLYECSHEHLDRIVSLVTKCGALGSRLTGAGWGGCSVTLTTADNASKIVSALQKDFYVPRGLSTEGNVFISSPADRANIFS